MTISALSDNSLRPNPLPHPVSAPPSWPWRVALLPAMAAQLLAIAPFPQGVVAAFAPRLIGLLALVAGSAVLAVGIAAPRQPGLFCVPALLALAAGASTRWRVES
jgi:hypothetical protein